MKNIIKIAPLTMEAFASFGDVLEANGAPSFMINQNRCARYHDLANLDFIGEEARANISMAHSQPYRLPFELEMVERHPLGSQAFIPLSEQPYLVIVAEDNNGVPGMPQAFLTNGKQGVNYHRNTWHGTLTPLDTAQSFAIIDRVGKGVNVEEHHFEIPFEVTNISE